MLADYVSNVLVSFDCFASAVLGGEPDETISGRTGAAWLAGRALGKIFCAPIDVLMHVLGQYPTWRGHCVAAIDGDRRRAQRVIDDHV